MTVNARDCHGLRHRRSRAPLGVPEGEDLNSAQPPREPVIDEVVSRARWIRRTPASLAFCTGTPHSGCVAMSANACSRSSRTAPGAAGRFTAHQRATSSIWVAARRSKTIGNAAEVTS